MNTIENIPCHEFIRKLIKREPCFEALLDGEAVSSFKPVDALWGYTCHSHMVPPYKPDETLILGYGGGQVAELMRKIWGAVKIIGVDLMPCTNYLEYKMHTCDADDFIHECTRGIIKTRFDYVVVDLFADGKVPDFVFKEGTAKRLKQMTKTLLCINTKADDFDLLKNYFDAGFKFHRHVRVMGNTVSFWGVA